MLKIAIIGGSGLDEPDFLKAQNLLDIETDYGKPSSLLLTGKMHGVEIILLSRHGTKHQYTPTRVNNRANIKALQKAGATHIIATTACGSLREDIDRGDLIILDQFIDFTRFRKTSFVESFEDGVVHPAMPYPFDGNLRSMLYKKARQLNLNVHDKGCVVTIEGPRLSTAAESKMFRVMGADVINMSTAPEAMLANEAGIPYAAVAMSTDYDSWKEDEKPVTWDDILEVFNKNADNVKKLIIEVIKEFKE